MDYKQVIFRLPTETHRALKIRAATTMVSIQSVLSGLVEVFLSVPSLSGFVDAPKKSTSARKKVTKRS